jgi:hypothetical protein
VKYMLLLTTDPKAGPQEGTPEFDDEMSRWNALNEEMKRAGVYVVASGLQLPDSATTLRAHDGEPVLTDGPFAETKEMLFSFYVIDVPDLDAAAEWAAKTPVASYGSVEIRPTQGYESL